MPNKYQNSTFFYSNESDTVLSKNQENLLRLENALQNDERVIFKLKQYIPEKEIHKQELSVKIDRLRGDFSINKGDFKNKITFHNIFSIFKSFFAIIFITIRRIFWILIIFIQKYRLKRNIRRNQSHQKNLEMVKTDISFIYSQRRLGLELFKGVWLSVEEIQLRREAEIGLADNFASMSDREFEFFTSELLKEMDYEIVGVTPAKGDFGTDIVAKKNGMTIAVQCKKYNEKNSVGNTAIQQLIGSMRYYHASHSIFVTTSYYTPQAREQIKNASIELWDKDTLHGYVKKYLLKKNISEIFDAIENAKNRDHVKKQEARIKIEERKERQRDKTICPICGGRKLKNRKMCYRCKEENRRIKKRDRQYDDGGDYPPFWNTSLGDIDWDDFNRRFYR